ncbi:MAG: serine/threonine-protein kinase [Myxococcota bacterium]
MSFPRIPSFLFDVLLGRARRAEPRELERAIAVSRQMVEDRCRSAGTVREDPSHLRDRVVLHLSIGGAVGGLFLVVLAGFTLAGVCTSYLTLALHAMAVAFVGGALLLLRQGTPSPRLTRSVEAFALIGSFLLYGAMAAVSSAEAFATETLVLIYCMAMIGRSVFTPSSALHTGLLAFGAAVPFLGATLFLSHAHGIADQTVVLAVVWYVAIGALAAAVSKVIFGLRTEVRAAMRLGQYTLEQKIGEGGMGRVYRGRHAMLRRETAIKIMSESSTDGRSEERFEREVQLTARLTHPNTVTVFDYGRTADGLFYYAMELIEGETLQSIVEATGPMPPDRVVHVLRQVASALQEAHQLGLIHRDIKPTNIMLARIGGEDDIVKVLDFGLVRDLSSGAIGKSDVTTVVGTPDYMAPEVISDPEAVDARVDIYALGAVGYYLLTGERLFDATTPLEVCAHQLHSTPSPVEEISPSVLPFELAALIEACLAKDPEDRPRNARRVLQRLHPIDVEAWTEERAAEWWRVHDRAFQNAATAEPRLSETVEAPIADPNLAPIVPLPRPGY